ncbi:uncharacterized protein ARMOST_20560 [Armillaria ostoyae]|uniref:Uncharacterized protein n=1 Tax=Armillaria ostoyae TaxID=47428 RepID=A0A284S7R4_ARMOS|nr:uncharacterized protein ARMOST_20560 [Armillaria ostoyae]
MAGHEPTRSRAASTALRDLAYAGFLLIGRTVYSGIISAEHSKIPPSISPHALQAPLQFTTTISSIYCVDRIESKSKRHSKNTQKKISMTELGQTRDFWPSWATNLYLSLSIPMPVARH